MKNVKRVSGISYSKVILIVALMAFSYGGYKHASSQENSEDAHVDSRSTEALLQGTLLQENGKQSVQDRLSSSSSSSDEGIASNAATPKALSSWSQEEFQALTQRTLRELPRLSDLRKLSQREVHHTPEIINRAGEKLGIVAELLETHPNFQPEAEEFYIKCLAQKEFPTAIRALCLANHRNLRMKSGESPEWKEDEMRMTNEDIRTLAEQVPFH